MAGKTQTGIVPAGQGTKKIGRPSSFTQDIADELCRYLAMGQSLRKACTNSGMPTVKTVFNWMATNEDFLQQYARAKQESADAMAEEILDISDDMGRDVLETENGYIANPTKVQRDRLRVETRKWLMAKMKPKVYGDTRDPAASSTINFNFGNQNYVKGDIKPQS